MDVLEQRVPEHLVVLGGSHDGWDSFESCRPGGADPALPHHDLVALPAGTNDDRLKHPHGLDAGREVVERFLVEGSARLTRVGVDAVERELFEGRARGSPRSLRHHRLLAGCVSRFAVVLWAARDQGFQPTA